MVESEYELTQTDRLCFNCPLPDCDERDPRCLRNVALGDPRAERRQYERLYKRDWRQVHATTSPS